MPNTRKFTRPMRRTPRQIAFVNMILKLADEGRFCNWFELNEEWKKLGNKKMSRPNVKDLLDVLEKYGYINRWYSGPRKSFARSVIRPTIKAYEEFRMIPGSVR